MKNKVLISLLSLCALLSLSSCEKRETEVLLPGANLALRMYVEGASTTKTNGGDTVGDLATESTISTLSICLVKKEGLNDESPVTIITGSKNVAWKVVSDGVYEVNAIVPDTIVAGDYLMYVIANKPSWMTITQFSHITGSFTETAADLEECWADNSFLMVNKQDAVTVPETIQAGVTVSLDPTGEKETATVTIERLATKIVVKPNLYMEVAPLLTEVMCSGANPGDPDIKGAIAAMQIDSCSLFNCVKSFNLIQRWNDESPVTGAAHLLDSPSSSTSYAIGSEGYYNNTPSELVFQPLGTIFYCMENNSPYYTDFVAVSDASAGTKMKGRVTGLVFKARAGFAKGFSGDVVINEDLGVEDKEVVWTKGVSQDIFYETLYQYKGNYYGDLACLLKYNSGLAGLGTPAGSPTVEELREAGVKVYVDGYMYYNYWIEDKNYTDKGKNYLSVMRNTFYDINITAINSLGDEYPCGGDSYVAGDPISVDVPKLTIAMDIPDWVNRNADYTL